MTLDILGTPLDRLIRFFEKDFGKGRFHAEVLFREIFKRGNPGFLQAPEFLGSPKFSAELEGRFRLDPGEVVHIFQEENLTKFITRLSDGLEIESVIIPMTRYHTLCVSSQVGCRMGCRFCETGRMGFKRSLSVSEITGQLYNARHTLQKEIKNIVFMGMGEPFDNYEAVMDAVQVMNEQKGFDVALRHITLSTAGLVPGIRRLAGLNLPNLRLAVSINGADDATRSKIMPVNRTYPLNTLKAALMKFPLSNRGTFLFEYILIRGLNDSPDHARNLADFIHPLPVRLNLIPFNPVSGFKAEPPRDSDMHEFAQLLTDKGVFVIKRWSKGRSVSAGCGQLGRNL
ncbi:23S rRNA (adenine(2503)-C(2))-methyltransferase RlmN [Desulfospira joergensenii]|uniref:23S rRNA (adenine(2503)-C(2))-methyltransferase RlmN n=1 Tax=Desulfospira joergensenii TaxID=53329 RepID=UPI0003B47A72|nr:23S rRNA (adenine(2503)-C(2))-methyltransferase RlmN [Desulfospira joergensenii]